VSAPGAGGTIRIKGGAIWDPAHGRGVIGDLCIEDGRIVASLPPAAPVFDARGSSFFRAASTCTATSRAPPWRMARLLCPEAAGGPCLPSTDDTAGVTPPWGTPPSSRRRRADRGARRPPRARRAADRRQGSFRPGREQRIVLDLARRGRQDELRACLAWLVESARAFAVKLVNPGGVEAWKEGRAPGEAATLLASLVRAVESLGLPHPAHVHLPGLGTPGKTPR